MKNYLGSADSVSITATSACAAGDLVIQGDVLGVAQTSAAIGDTLDLITRGRFRLPAASADAWAASVPLYWDVANKRLSATAGVFLGPAMGAKLAGTAAADVEVRGAGQLGASAAQAVQAGGLKLVATSVAGIQSVVDTIKAAGGGELHFVSGAEYVWPADASTVNIDSTYITIKFNRSQHNLSACPDGFVAFSYSSTVAGFGEVYPLRTIEDGWIFTDRDGALADTGPTAIKFDTALVNSSNRVQLHRMRIKGMRKGLEFGSRSYFVRLYDCQISRNRHALYQTASALDFAEMVTLSNCVIDNNYSHITDLGGQIWRAKQTSFDYHSGYCFNFSGGAKLFGDDVHIEWNYGANAGETNCPFTFNGANASLHLEGGSALMYTGAGQNPYYPALASMNSASQRLILRLAKASKLGRLTDTTDFDALAVCTVSAMPIVELRAHVDGIAVSDLPAMTCVAETWGGIGQLRNGADNPFNELAHRIAVTGTAAIASMAADENGVTRKNGKNMLKITGQGKVVIAFPYYEANRRHAWSFFTNPGFVTGSVTIKERQTGYGTKFDGANVTFAVDTRGAVYSPNTVTVSAGAAAWTRRSWKDCNTSAYPVQRQNMAGLTLIEIDTTGMTAGALYLSHVGFDVM